MSSCHLYTASNYMHYSLKGENVTALYNQWFIIYRCPLRQIWLYMNLVSNQENFITNRKLTSCCKIKILNRLWKKYGLFLLNFARNGDSFACLKGEKNTYNFRIKVGNVPMVYCCYIYHKLFIVSIFDQATCSNMIFLSSSCL